MNSTNEKVERIFLDNVQSGAVKEVQFLLQQGVNVNARSKGPIGNTALHFTIMSSFYGWCQNEEGSYLKIAELLLKNGADIHVPNKDNVTALNFVLLKGTVGMIKLFLNSVSNCKIFSERVRRFDDIRNIVKFLLKKSIFRILPRDFPILLEFCLKHEDEKTFEMLLKQNVRFDVNAVLPGMSQPIIHSVVCTGTCKMIQDLVDYGVNIDKQNKNYESPLHYALQSGKTKNALFLIESGASVFCENSEGRTALHVAAELGLEVEILKAILSKGIDINITSKIGKKTALHQACRTSCTYKTVKFLLENGADLEARDALGETPIFSVMKNYFVRDGSLIEYLLELKADINIQNFDGETPLSFALKESPVFNDNLKLLVAHLAIMVADKSKICEKNLEVIQHNAVHNFYRLCNFEINKMKGKICSSSNVSYLDFFTENLNRLTAFAMNEEIVEVLNAMRYLNDFPIYGGLLKTRFIKAKLRAELLQNAMNILYINLKKKCPYDILHNVFTYLDEKELATIL